MAEASAAIIETAYEMYDMRSKGLSCDQIAAKYGVNVATVYRYLTKLRQVDPTIPKRGEPPAPTEPEPPTHDERAAAWDNAIRNGESPRKVAKDAGVTYAEVLNAVAVRRRHHPYTSPANRKKGCA